MAQDPNDKKVEVMFKGKKVHVQTEIEKLYKDGWADDAFKVLIDITIIGDDGTVLAKKFAKGHKEPSKKELKGAYDTGMEILQKYNGLWKEKTDDEKEKNRKPDKVERAPKIQLLGQDFVYHSMFDWELDITYGWKRGGGLWGPKTSAEESQPWFLFHCEKLKKYFFINIFPKDKKGANICVFDQAELKGKITLKKWIEDFRLCRSGYFEKKIHYVK